MANDEKVESSAEIISDIRERADTAERHGEHQTHNDGVAMLLRSIADRIEAAWKREREELDKRISDLEAYAKLWTGRADELRLKCDEVVLHLSKEEYKGMQEALSEHDRLCEMLSESRKSVGNAAAMREALLRIVEFAKAWADPGADAATTLGLIIDKAESALSAPARNCDRFNHKDPVLAKNGAVQHWQNETDCAVDFGQWLLAPAASRKGDGDGR